MTVWTKRLDDRARITIDIERYSEVLANAGTGPINAIAAEAKKVAQDRVRASGKRFIGVKLAKRFQLVSTDIGRPRSELASKVRVPVALVFNNSRWAVEQEVGSLSGDKAAERPLTTAMKQVGGKKGVRVVREKSLNELVKFGTASRAARRKKRGRR